MMGFVKKKLVIGRLSFGFDLVQDGVDEYMSINQFMSTI